MIRSQARWLCAALLLAAATAGARDKILLHSGPDVTLPAAGLRLKPFKEFKSLPWAAPQVVTYRRQDTGESFDACEVRELFVGSQVAGNFVGECGRIVVATLLYAPPDATWPVNGRGHIRQADFDAAKADHPFSGNADDVRGWLGAFVGKPAELEAEKTSPANLRVPYRHYVFASSLPGAVQAYVLLPGADSRRPPVAIVFELDDGRDYRDLLRAVQAVVSSVQFTEMRTVDKEAEKNLQSRKPARPPGAGGDDNRDALAAAKQQVIQQIRNLKDWWYLELPHYVLTSNMDTRSRRLVTLIQEDIEEVRGQYAALSPPRVPITDVSVVRVFRDRAQYLDYIPREMKWSGGIWMPGKKELVISPVDTNRPNESRRITLLTVYHEAYHQYMFYALGGRTLPPWIDEGHATLFEGCDVDARRHTVDLEEEPSRVAGFMKVLDEGRPLRLDRFMRLDLAAFYRGDLAANYSTAYALVYFLRKAFPQYPDRGYENLCDDIIDATMKVAPGDEAFAIEGVVANVDMLRFEKELIDFWKSPTKRHRAAKFTGFASGRARPGKAVAPAP